VLQTITSRSTKRIKEEAWVTDAKSRLHKEQADILRTLEDSERAVYVLRPYSTTNHKIPY